MVKNNIYTKSYRTFGYCFFIYNKEYLYLFHYTNWIGQINNKIIRKGGINELRYVSKIFGLYYINYFILSHIFIFEKQK
jgi:hypothetical protein